MKPRKKTQCIEDLLYCFDVTDTGCWEYKYARTKAGYGLVAFEEGREYVHRLMYKFTHPDEDISELFICHKCDNPPCGNPDHLFSGTQFDNSRDMSKKKRFPRKSEHPNSKLTQEDVDNIRLQYTTTDETQQSLASKYGVSRQLIGQIIKRIAWKEDT